MKVTESADVRLEGVVEVVANRLTAVVTTKGGQMESTQENEGRIAVSRVRCQPGILIFAVRSWHTEAWSARTRSSGKPSSGGLPIQEVIG